MAALWNELFDKYPSITSMLQGAWAQVDQATPGVQWQLSTANPRTGTQNLRWYNADSVFSTAARRVFGAPKTAAGVEFALYLPQLPVVDLVPNNGTTALAFVFVNASNQIQVAFIVGTDGSIIAINFPNGVLSPYVLLARSNPCVVAKAYCNIGLKVGLVDPAHGTIEARVNGVTVLNASGLNTDPNGTGDVSQITLSCAGQAIPEPGWVDIDDMHTWDTLTGNGPVDFVGNASVCLMPPTSDTALADWSAFGGGPPNYPLLNDEDDSTGIEAGTVGMKSAFGIGSLPGDVAGVIYLQANWRALKTDAGNCDVTPGFISGAIEGDGSAFTLNTAETWQFEPFAIDPDSSGAPWTPTSANAAELVFTRSL